MKSKKTIKQNKLSCLKNSKYRPFIETIYIVYMVSFGISVLANLVSKIIEVIDPGSANETLLFWRLIFRVIFPFLTLLTITLYLFVKKDFNKFLKLSKENFVVYLVALILCWVILTPFLALAFLDNFILKILSGSFFWLAMVLGFIITLMLVYSLAYWLLTAKLQDGRWKFLLKTAANLFFVPVGLGVLVDYFFIFIYTFIDAIGWLRSAVPDQQFFYLPLRFAYAVFVLIYYIKYKKELTRDKVLTPITYLLIVMFILYWLEFLINMTLLPRI